jgi:hypothetical protein
MADHELEIQVLDQVTEETEIQVQDHEEGHEHEIHEHDQIIEMHDNEHDHEHDHMLEIQVLVLEDDLEHEIQVLDLMFDLMEIQFMMCHWMQTDQSLIQ